MGYMIQYGKRTKQEQELRRMKYAGAKKAAVIFLLIAGLIRLLVPQSVVWLRNILIPGLTDEATAAFSEMMGRIREGVFVPDALEAFCREIVADTYGK